MKWGKQTNVRSFLTLYFANAFFYNNQSKWIYNAQYNSMYKIKGIDSPLKYSVLIIEVDEEFLG